MTIAELIPRTKPLDTPQAPTKRKPNWQFTTTPDVSEIKAMIAELENLDLPGDDGEPMENERERIQINLGLQSLDYVWRDRDDFYAGGNMFVYFSLSQAQSVIEEINNPLRPKRTFRGPDLFVVLNVDGSYRRQKWVVWNEDGHYPNVVVELLSPSTREIDLGEKKDLYEQTFHTREYFCFDYMNPTSEQSLMGWRLDATGHYQPIEPDARGWLWSEELELWVGTWEGIIERDSTTWLRFYTADGELVLTREEAAAQSAQEATIRAHTAEAELAELRAEVERMRSQQG